MTGLSNVSDYCVIKMIDCVLESRREGRRGNRKIVTVCAIM